MFPAQTPQQLSKSVGPLSSVFLRLTDAAHNDGLYISTEEYNALHTYNTTHIYTRSEHP